MRTGKSVRLDGSLSYDAAGNLITYSWSIKSKPVGSNATLSSANIVNPLFTTDLDGLYIINLIVNNGIDNSSAYELGITSTNDILQMVSTVAIHGSGTINNNYFISGTRFSMEIKNISNETIIFSSNSFNIIGSGGMRIDYFSNTASLTNDTSFGPGKSVTITSTILQSMLASNNVMVLALFTDPISKIKSGLYSMHYPYDHIITNFPFVTFSY